MVLCVASWGVWIVGCRLCRGKGKNWGCVVFCSCFFNIRCMMYDAL